MADEIIQNDEPVEREEFFTFAARYSIDPGATIEQLTSDARNLLIAAVAVQREGADSDMSFAALHLSEMALNLVAVIEVNLESERRKGVEHV
jgi:hypothetical protein